MKTPERGSLCKGPRGLYYICIEPSPHSLMCDTYMYMHIHLRPISRAVCIIDHSIWRTRRRDTRYFGFVFGTKRHREMTKCHRLHSTHPLSFFVARICMRVFT
jgi:hypothetical protein